MTVRNLDALLTPSSVAWIGGDEAPSGSAAARNLIESGFGGDLFFVHPSRRALEGKRCYPSIDSLPKAPDLAVVCAPIKTVPAIVTRLGERGTRAAAILSGGKSSGWPAHRLEALRTELLDAARPTLLRILGPDCLGLITPGIRLNASATPVPVLPGQLAFVTQSDTIGSAVLDWAHSRSIGFSHMVSLGEMADVDLGDLLDYLASSPQTNAIILYMERITHARKFMSAARAAARMKPVIVLKGGRREAIEALSDTAATIDSDAIYHTAFRRSGMLRARDLLELFEAVETLAQPHPAIANRLVILSNGHGAGVLAADALMDEGGLLADPPPEAISRLDAILPAGWSGQNPIDILKDASPARYAEALKLLVEQSPAPILILHAPSPIASAGEVARAIIAALKPGSPWAKPPLAFTCWLGGESGAEARALCAEHRIPTYDTPSSAVRGYMQLIRYRRNQDLLVQTPPSLPSGFTADIDRVREIIRGALAEDRHWLTEIEAKEMLAAYAIPTAPSYEACCPEAQLHGLTVQPMLRRPLAHELIVGMTKDPLFGPVLLFGHGGAAVDAIQDTTLALPPLNMHLARELMSRTRVFKLLEKQGGVDLDDLAFTLVKFSQLICDVAEIAEIEINPLLAHSEGVVVLDARVRVEPAAASALERLAIRPYPKELEEMICLPDGSTLMLRPIRPEDEPALQALFSALSPEEIRLRFLHSMKTLPESLAKRLTQIDYDREMALVLTPPCARAELFGSTRISADPDNQRAEFAIVLRKDLTGLGLGPMLMRRIIDYAKSRGIREIYGDVLGENRPMLRLCSAFGFSTRREPDDPSVVSISLPL